QRRGIVCLMQEPQQSASFPRAELERSHKPPPAGEGCKAHSFCQRTSVLLLSWTKLTRRTLPCSQPIPARVDLRPSAHALSTHSLAPNDRLASRRDIWPAPATYPGNYFDRPVRDPSTFCRRYHR